MVTIGFYLGNFLYGFNSISVLMRLIASPGGLLW